MYGTNCYLFGDENTKEIVIMDPGGNASEIKKIVEKEGFRPLAVILTHKHGDHVAAALEVSKHFGNITLIGHEKDFRKTKFDKGHFRFVKESDEINIGNEILHVIDSPGHTKGGIMLVSYENKLVFTGDTLFIGSIGRTDFPGGNYEQLMGSIRKIMRNEKITDDFLVLSGHMGVSSIGVERKTNMFRNDFL
jgi:glyoxylase-like metal-dependent hydrolase (beta-lactamase superfamily II)